MKTTLLRAIQGLLLGGFASALALSTVACVDGTTTEETNEEEIAEAAQGLEPAEEAEEEDTSIVNPGGDESDPTPLPWHANGGAVLKDDPHPGDPVIHSAQVVPHTSNE